jgi:hypothetical protein
MFVRVATFDGVDVDEMAPVVEWFDEHGAELSARLAGYEGSLSLLDRDNRRGIDIFFFDTEDNARRADELMDQGPPSEMPEDVQQLARRAKRSFRAVMEVFDADGRLRPLIERTAR